MIQWFPGHMAKALREIKEKASIADLFIITLDARAPISTYNEDFDQIAPQKPRLFVITKKDLGDARKYKTILDRFDDAKDKVLIVNLKQKNAASKITEEANKLLATKRAKDLARGLLKPRLRAIVIGVPNSGKSTLINTLSKSRKTKVGNKPGVTRGQQWITTGDIQLLDTPGVLWPKFEDELIGIKLAIIGSIKVSIIPQQELFFSAYKLISQHYPSIIQTLGLEPSSIEATMYNNLIALCNKKSFVLPGSKSDEKKGMTWFINYARDLKGVTYD